ncbi:MAG TPA: hypothetical protein VFH90_08345, partial [Candidatus Limnocylindria bacterium]|nr:hypothetical protein [Candidatus Limnocylindria bacterium]
VICTDKTGTLTENRMRVERMWTPAGTYTVSGRRYAPEGEVYGPDGGDTRLQRLAQVAAACNDAVLHPPSDPDGEWTLSGDPTEGALAALAGRLGVDAGELDARLPRHGEVAFDASRRRMTTVHKCGDAFWVAVKGAVEALAPLLRDQDADLAATAREMPIGSPRRGTAFSPWPSGMPSRFRTGWRISRPGCGWPAWSASPIRLVPR